MRAVMIIAYQGFRDEEYFETKKVLEENGIEVITASWDTGTATGKLGGSAEINININEIDIGKFNAIIYIGGPGSKEYWNNLTAHNIAKQAIEFNKVVAAICSAPIILARAGILKGKKATCFMGDIAELKKEAAVYTASHIEQDGLIITADGPDSAIQFGCEIVKTLYQIQ